MTAQDIGGIKATARAERHRVADIIRRDRTYQANEELRREAVRDETKQRGESDLQYRARMARQSLTGGRFGDILTPEAEQHGEFEDSFVVHDESKTKAQTKRSTAASGVARLYENGVITAEQLQAAVMIAQVAERIECTVAVKVGGMEPRVDNSGSMHDQLVETMHTVRCEIAYTKWRARLPTPKRMIIDMLVMTQPMARTARSFGMDWPRARNLVKKALDRWIDIFDKVSREIDEQDAERVYRRLGEGRLR
jgi:hypothetical protein